MSESCPRCGLVSTLPGVALCPRCLLAEPDADDIALPPELPGLELGPLLGRGGMGQVFRARHARLARDVAVKLINPELSVGPRFKARFEREARALGRLNHTHVIVIYDYGITPEGDAYLVMEYASGGTLADKLPLPPLRAVEVALALADALSLAHESGLVHRDIKPENVLFDARGNAKLADFGLARAFEPDAADGLTHPAWVGGTPAYMAPEARAGEPPHPAADQYALGVLLRAMLSGSPRPARDLEGALGALVARATAELPENRFSDLKAFAVALGALQAELARPEASKPQRTASHQDLPPEERSWLQAVSLMFAGATATALYALVISFTPRVMRSEEALSMIAFGYRTLPGDRVLTQARFEVWPTLSAGAAFAVALTSYGLMRRHWRHAGLEVHDLERPIASASHVFKLGAGLFALLLGHREHLHTTFARLGPYLPVLGGTLEFVLLYLVWQSLLEAIRCQRPLLGERRLWLGFALGLIPPSVSFFEALGAAR